jgi:hypothetical protein
MAQITLNSTGVASSGALALQSNGTTTAVTIDTSQNVGIGVTPSAWGSSYKAQQIGQAGVLSGHTSVPALTLTSNAYENSGWKAITTSSAHRIDLSSDNNATIFYRAPSVSAGSALTWSESMRIDSSGNLLVGTTSTGQGTRIVVKGAGSVNWSVGPDNSTGNVFYVLNTSGTGVGLTTGNTSWSAVSDERIKDIIEPITDAINKVSTLRAVIGKYKTDEEGIRRSFLIAQDVQAVLPEVIDTDTDEQGTMSIRYTEIIPLLVAAIKEQSQLITTLTDRITALEAK